MGDRFSRTAKSRVSRTSFIVGFPGSWNYQTGWILSLEPSSMTKGKEVVNCSNIT